MNILTRNFASTRPVQIATCVAALILYTPHALPPHAPCRLQRQALPFAARYSTLCLHTPRADCNRANVAEITIQNYLCLHTLRADCNGRNAQNCNMHFLERVLSR